MVLPHKKTPKAELYNLINDPQEKTNVIADHPEIVQALEKKITGIVCKGRTTAGVPQANDTGWWKDLTWMDATEYNVLHVERE